MSEPRKSVFLPIDTEHEVHVSETEKKKVRAEKEKIKGSCAGCAFMESCTVGLCLQDCAELLGQPEYECAATFREDDTNVIFVEVKDESI